MAPRCDSADFTAATVAALSSSVSANSNSDSPSTSRSEENNLIVMLTLPLSTRAAGF